MIHLLTHIAVVFALIPGSLLFVAVLLWRILRRAVGFRKPSLPLRTTSGNVVYTEADWHRDAKRQYPIRYAVFEALPARLGRIWSYTKAIPRLIWSPPLGQRDVMLAQAFEVFCDWVEENRDRVFKTLPVEEGEEGPVARYNTRMAEMFELFTWWTEKRPAHVKRIYRQPKEVREFNLIDLELDDEHNFARLANVWRDLT